MSDKCVAASGTLYGLPGTCNIIPCPPFMSVPSTDNSQNHLKETFKPECFYFKAPDLETQRYHSLFTRHSYSWRSVLKICKLPAITLAGKNYLLVLMEAVKMKMTSQFITMFSVGNLPIVNSLTIKPEILHCLDAHQEHQTSNLTDCSCGFAFSGPVWVSL